MKSPLLQHHVRQRRSAAGSIEVTAFADPWDALDDGREKRENWLLSYIDILTLFLTLFVVLLAQTASVVLLPAFGAACTLTVTSAVLVQPPEMIEKVRWTAV